MADYRVIDAEQLESDLTVVADAIREKGGTSEQLAFPNGMADAVRGIQSGGELFEFERHCINLDLYSLNIFGKKQVVLNLDRITELMTFCSIPNSTRVEERINNTVEELTLNCKKQITALQQFLHGNSYNPDDKLRKVTLNADTSKCTSFQNAFSNTRALEVIDGTPLDLSSATRVTSMFAICNNLKEVRFVEGSISISISISNSPLLSDESIQSIINGLATVETAQTLTFHKDVKAKLTEAQISQITSKNWTVG